MKLNIGINGKMLIFVLMGGILCGLFMSCSFMLIYVIRLWAIYTNFIFLFFMPILIIKFYQLVYEKIINVKFALIYGFPLFLICLTVMHFLVQNDSAIPTTSSGKWKLFREWIEYTTILTLVLAFVYVPVTHLLVRYKMRRLG